MKCMLFFGIAISIVIITSFLLYWLVANELIGEQNPNTARLIANQRLMEIHWMGFSKAPDKESQDFKKQMESLVKRIRNLELEAAYIRYPVRSPADAPPIFDLDPISDQIEEQKQKDLREKYSKTLECFPTNDPDFDNEKAPGRTPSYTDEEGTYHFFEGVRVDRRTECVDCHWKKLDHGQLMGVLHVAIPKTSLQKTFQKYFAYMLGVAIISAFLSLAAVSVVIRWVVIRPLRSLRNVAESISRGEITKRVEIHTRDEFEVLGEAFNRMLQHLINAQEMLKKVNNELNMKVDELAHVTIQLYETNQTKSDFMATMSHELRTPLNSILGFSDVLGSISTLNDKQKRYVENINKSGRTLLTMINDILDMAKMEAGRMEARTTSFNIVSTIAAQCDMAKPLLDRKNIDLETNIEPNLPMMKQDESRLQQILNNLISNAIKFTPEGGRIKILVRMTPASSAPTGPAPLSMTGLPSKAAKTRDMMELKVSDTGVGISEEDLQIIFEKFRQGKGAVPEGDTMKREHSGSGLGLSIVKEICKILQGEISVESQLGVGSTFTVKLPWIIEPRAKMESDMIAEIQQFARNRLAREAHAN